MPHIAHFYDAPSRPDRGRRLIPPTGHYLSYDFLKDPRPLHLQPSPPIGHPSPHPLKFHRGFYRRPQASIAQDAQRLHRHLLTQQRQEAAHAVHLSAEAAHAEAAKEREAERQQRRHFPQRGKGEGEGVIGGGEGEGRVGSPPQSAGAEMAPVMRSRILGVGGVGDTLPSYGVVDAFMGPRYADYAYVPVREGRRRPGTTQMAEVMGGRGGGKGEGRPLAEEVRLRAVEREKNARRKGQLDYLFGAGEQKQQTLS